MCKHCVLFVFIHGVLFLLTCLYVKCFLCVQTLCVVLCIYIWSVFCIFIHGVVFFMDMLCFIGVFSLSSVVFFVFECCR